MKLGAYLHRLLEALTWACFVLWCVFSTLSIAGTQRIASGLSPRDLGFVTWFAAAWWGWAALIRCEGRDDADRSHPAWVVAGLVVGIGCVAYAFWWSLPDAMPAPQMSIGDAAAAILALLLLGVAPAGLAIGHLLRFGRGG